VLESLPRELSGLVAQADQVPDVVRETAKNGLNWLLDVVEKDLWAADAVAEVPSGSQLLTVNHGSHGGSQIRVAKHSHQPGPLAGARHRSHLATYVMRYPFERGPLVLIALIV
jgi:hypothetical protein